MLQDFTPLIYDSSILSFSNFLLNLYFLLCYKIHFYYVLYCLSPVYVKLLITHLIIKLLT